MDGMGAVRTPGRQRQSRTLGTLMVLTGWLLLPVGALFEFMCFGAMRPGGQKPPWSPLVGGVLGLIGLGVVLGARYLLRQGKRHLSPVTTLAEVLRDPPFVLYLRTFTDDPRLAAVTPQANLRSTFGDEHNTAQSLRTEEEQLQVAIRPFGSMVTVGRPGEQLPPVGARRLYLEDGEWQQGVLQLMAEAGESGLVLMGAGPGAALQWELAQAVALVPPQRLVLVVPMEAEAYEPFRRQAGALFPASLPDYPAAPRLRKYAAKIKGAVYFDPDWTPHFVRFDTPRSPGNFQRVIESRFVYGLRPVYERLSVPWPGVRLRLPVHAHPTRRQVPLFIAMLAVPIVVFGSLIWSITGGL